MLPEIKTEICGGSSAEVDPRSRALVLSSGCGKGRNPKARADFEQLFGHEGPRGEDACTVPPSRALAMAG